MLSLLLRSLSSLSLCSELELFEFACTRDCACACACATYVSTFVTTALGFLTKKAANWVTAYLTDFNEGRVPFNGLWTEFVDAFKLRFESIDPGTEARDHIKNLSQLPGQNVAEYAQNFKDIGGRTGLSDMDLLDRFNDGLLPEIKKNIVLVNIAQGIAKTLDEAIR